MAIIYLTKGFETIVDDDTYKDLDSYLWYASGTDGRPARRLRLGPRKIIYLYHQVLCVLPWVLNNLGLVVDHINGNPLDNRKENLRIVSQKINIRNTISYGMRQGVAYDSTHDRYKAYIDQPDRPRINVGTYLTQEAAELALAKVKEELGLANN